jgi:tRNA threonylcarbamoyl adenosine modification protein YeaZ
MILSIEAAIAGGSLCLASDGHQIAGWAGESDGLRAEHLMSKIDALLISVDLDRSSLGTIAVSSGPGSFTGIRVGMATALGLRAALRIPLVSLSALESVAFTYQHTGIVAVPMGRGGAAAQEFVDGLPVEQPYSIAVDDLAMAPPASKLLIHPDLCPEGDQDVVLFDPNVALAIAKTASAHPGRNSAPIFVSKI